MALQTRRVSHPRFTFGGALLITALVTATCGPGAHIEGRSAAARHLEVVGVWSGAEQERFTDVLAQFERETGVSVTYTSLGRNIAGALDQRLAEARAPDVAMLPQPGLLRRLAQERRLVPLDGSVVDAVRQNFGSVWRRLGSVAGKLYGVWFKAANKSLIWYNLAAFEQLGVVPPGDLDALVSLTETFTQRGIPAFSVGAADGWTLTDWFENIYIRIAGARRYDQLASHRLPWTDPTVQSALVLLGKLLTPTTMSGGTEGALRTGFEASVRAAWALPAAAAMVFEGDFVAGLLGDAGAKIGVDVDVFPFPGRAGATPAVIGGGDAAVLLRRSTAGAALLRFLAGTRAATIWASAGGFISPNLNLDLTVYPDPTTRNIARRIIEAGDDFRFDLSDQLPASFGAVEGQGMRKALQDFLADRDVETTSVQLEDEAAAAYGR